MPSRRHPHATIQTWGTGHFGSNGMLHHLDAELFGSNVGHAAIELEFPVDEEGTRLIQKYCNDGKEVTSSPRNLDPFKDKNIPFQIKTVTAPDGSKEQYYVVRFSWWGHEMFGHAFNSLQEDQLAERLGVQFDYGEKFSYLARDTRKYRGHLGEQIKTLGPIAIAHIRNLDSDPRKRELIITKINIVMLEQEIESIKILSKKLIETAAAKKTATNLSKTELLMLKNLLPPEKYQEIQSIITRSLTPEELNKIREMITKHLLATGEKLVTEESTFENGLHILSDSVTDKELEQIASFDNIEDYLTIGSPPDNEVTLPITSDLETEHSLNVEAMLAKMHELVVSKEGFSLEGKNCSETVGQILEAGCLDPKLKQIAKTRALGAFGNPQEVMNKAARIQRHLSQHTTPSLWESIGYFSPIASITGALLKNIMKEGYPTGFMDIISPLALIPMAIISLASFIVRGVFNPLKAFNDCKAIIDFAFSHNSILLMVTTSLFIAPIAAIFAIPAAMQKFIVNPIHSLLSNLFNSKKEKEPEILSESEKQKGQEIRAHIATKELEITKKETPVATLQAFIQALFDNEKSIPYFTEPAIKQITQALKATKQESAIIAALTTYVSNLQQQEPSKFAKLQLPNPEEIRQMKVADLYKTLCDLSLERAKTSTITTERSSEPSEHSSTKAVREKVLSEQRHSMITAAVQREPHSPTTSPPQLAPKDRPRA